MQEVDATNVHSLLACVPEVVKSQLLEQWLSLYLLPFILQHIPHALVREKYCTCSYDIRYFVCLFVFVGLFIYW